MKQSFRELYGDTEKADKIWDEYVASIKKGGQEAEQALESLDKELE